MENRQSAFVFNSPSYFPPNTCKKKQTYFCYFYPQWTHILFLTLSSSNPRLVYSWNTFFHFPSIDKNTPTPGSLSAISVHGGFSAAVFKSTTGSRHALVLHLNPFSDLFDLRLFLRLLSPSLLLISLQKSSVTHDFLFSCCPHCCSQDVTFTLSST